MGNIITYLTCFFRFRYIIMASIGLVTSLLTGLRSGFVTSIRGRRKGLVRKIYGAYENNEEYEAEIVAKKEKLKKSKKESLRPPKPAPKPLSTSVKDLRYENLGKDPRNKFANIMYNARTSKYRERNRVCALHGKSLIKEAMLSGSYVRSIYFSDFEQLQVTKFV